MNEGLLRALCDAPGVSGWEDEVRELARAELEPHADEVRVDRLGNLIAVRRAARGAGDGPPLKVMVAAHMDEIGFMVKAIDERAVGCFEIACPASCTDRVFSVATLGNQPRSFRRCRSTSSAAARR